MATFSTKQVSQLYVANELKTPSVAASDSAGAIAVKADTAKTHLYFEHVGAAGITRSDLIDIKNINSIVATDADKMAYPLKSTKLVLDSSVNGGAPVAGHDYVLRVSIKNFIGISDEYQYDKFGTVRAITGMTASTFYKTLAMSLVKNFNREESELLKFSLETGGTAADTAGTLVPLTSATKESTLTGTYTGIIVEEKPQKWVLGTYEQTPVNYSLLPDNILLDGTEVCWGIATPIASTSKIANGHKIADLEYFCMGARADIYRNVGFPYNMETQYLVNPSLAYNTITISYFFQGYGENVHKSEKTITLVIPKVGATNSVSNDLANDIIDKIELVSGLTIAGLDTTGA